MKKFFALGTVLVVPAMAMAQEGEGLEGVLDTISGLLSTLSALLFGAAVVAFFYGVAKFILSSSQSDKADGKTFMIWGIVGIFVMSAVYGLVGILADTFNVGDDDTITVPSLPGSE